MYWSATDFTGNDTTWYFTDNPDNLGGKEIGEGGDLEEEKNYIREASIYDVRTEGGGGVSPKEDVVREDA